MWDRGRLLGILASIVPAVVFWIGFALVEAPTMVVGERVSGLHSVWTFVVCGGVGALVAGFAPLFALDVRPGTTSVDRLFDRLARPVDVDTEVGEIKGRSETYSVIGWSSLVLGMLPLVIMVTHGLDESWPIYLALALVLGGGGVAFLALRRRT
jgi:hypothetical protein